MYSSVERTAVIQRQTSIKNLRQHATAADGSAGNSNNAEEIRQQSHTTQPQPFHANWRVSLYLVTISLAPEA